MPVETPLELTAMKCDKDKTSGKESYKFYDDLCSVTVHNHPQKIALNSVETVIFEKTGQGRPVALFENPKAFNASCVDLVEEKTTLTRTTPAQQTRFIVVNLDDSDLFGRGDVPTIPPVKGL